MTRWQRRFARFFALWIALLCSSVAWSQPAREATRAASHDAVDARALGIALSIPAVPGDWIRTQRGPLLISYPRAIESQMRGALAHAEADARVVAAQLGANGPMAFDVRLVPDPTTMRAFAPPELPPPAYATGVAYPSIRLALVSGSAPETWEAPDVRRVLRHEVSHLVLEAATNHAAIPRWLSEGVAIQQSGENNYDRFTHLAVATVTRRITPLPQLDAAFGGSNDDVDIAYAESADFVAYLWREHDAERFTVLIDHLRDGASLDGALRQTYRASLAQLEYEWRGDLRARFFTAPLWASTGLAWLIGAPLLIIAFVRHRRRGRTTLARWATEEQAMQARLAITVVTPGLAQDDPPPVDPRTLN